MLIILLQANPSISNIASPIICEQIASQRLEICQGLYEKGHDLSPRSNNLFIALTFA